MILPLHRAVRTRLAEILDAAYGLDPQSLPPIVIEYPPNRALGDLALPLAFELARRLRKAPRAIAQELAAQFGAIPGVTRVEAAPNGYVNLFLDRPGVLLERLRGLEPAAAPTEPAVTAPGKTIVEHTAINPNKAAHVGHIRNAALGDTLVRLLRFQGTRVEVQNYIDDTGVQVADVVVGFRELERATLADVRAIADAGPLDHHCWDLYARVTGWYEEDEERLKLRAATLHGIERGQPETAELAGFIADRIVRRHLETMRRINVDYELLTWEGDILRLQFWARAFDILKAAGTVFLQTEGRLAGCWVMRIDEDAAGTGVDEAAAGPEDRAQDEDQGEPREKVIVRSDGTVTYVGKDIAYQFWKFGLLGRDFHYRVFERRPDGTVLWATSTIPTPDEASADRPPFGGADRTYNVIDVRQSYLQKLLGQALAAMGHVREAERSIHFSYEMVALSPRTARELGFDSGDDDSRFLGISGRKGLGVKADDLIDRLVAKALVEVQKRSPEGNANDAAPEGGSRRTAEVIAVAAVRYFMIKYSRSKVIAFDIDEALSFEGESGPYLQYAAVRARNIFTRLKEREGVEMSGVLARLERVPPAALSAPGEGDELWGLVLECSRLDEVVEQAVRTLELSGLAKYAFGLAQSFNALYHKYPILNEERADVRLWRAAVVQYFLLQMTRAIELMGFEVPDRM
jgi:arginyl-tRNA synthetase